MVMVGAAFMARDGLLVEHAARAGANGDIPQSELFDAALVAEAEISTGHPAHVRGEAPDEQVVVGCHRALDAATRRRGVFANAQAVLRRALEERVAHHHP